MAEISASMVMKLRKMSGQGMMDCKRALQEAGGDVDEAMGILRKKGLATMAKRAGRETSEGLVVCKKNADGRTAGLVSLCCETDFVAKSDAFIATAEKLGECSLICEAQEGGENILATKLDGETFAEILNETVSKTGEKTEVGDFVRYELAGSGLISTYIHFNNKVGTMVEIEASSDEVAANASVHQAANDVAMHVTATKPMGLDKDSISADVVAGERVIFVEQAKGKPEHIIDKIVEGKMKKFYAENCLVDQPFVKDDSKTVGEVIAEAGKAAGGEAKIKRFVRLEVG